MALIDRLAIEAYQAVDDAQVAAAYDAGSGRGYIGFSESLRLLKKRFSRTAIKLISFSDRAAMPRMYVDAAAVSSSVQGERYEKCIELVNVMAEAEALAALSVQNGVPQYLLPARRSPYGPLAERFPLYAQLMPLAFNEKNNVILGPRP